MLYQIYIFKFIIRLVEHHEASPALTPQKRTSTGGNQSPNTGTYHSETCQGVQLHLLCRCAGEMSLKITDDKCCFALAVWASVRHSHKLSSATGLTQTGFCHWNRNKLLFSVEQRQNRMPKHTHKNVKKYTNALTNTNIFVHEARPQEVKRARRLTNAESKLVRLALTSRLIRGKSAAGLS